MYRIPTEKAEGEVYKDISGHVVESADPVWSSPSSKQLFEVVT